LETLSLKIASPIYFSNCPQSEFGENHFQHMEQHSPVPIEFVVNSWLGCQEQQILSIEELSTNGLE